MSRRESNVETYIDTLSSGDANDMKSTQKSKEVNNNEIDELSKEFSEMGCIVDAMKKTPNICVETCIYESDTEKSEKSEKATYDNDEAAYSDEFEEDKSEEEDSVKTLSKSENTHRTDPNKSLLKLSKSQSSMSSNKPPVSISGRSGRSDFGELQGGPSVLTKAVRFAASLECPRPGYSFNLTDAVPLQNYLRSKDRSLFPGSIMLVKMTSVSIPQTRRINMSFSNERLREIERHNHILLTKILSARNTKKSSIPAREQPIKKPLPSAAVSRRNQQRQIDHDNMILLKKIQRAKSSALSIRR